MFTVESVCLYSTIAAKKIRLSFNDPTRRVARAKKKKHMDLL